jgi:hypothetical protein
MILYMSYTVQGSSTPRINIFLNIIYFLQFFTAETEIKSYKLFYVVIIYGKNFMSYH